MLKAAALLTKTFPDDARVLSAVYFGGACFGWSCAGCLFVQAHLQTKIKQ